MSVIIASGSRQFHLYRKETDMRKGFDSLCGIIGSEMQKQVLHGDAFIFINRSRTHIKLLVWEHGGFTIFYRRLEKGTFEIPAFDLDANSLQMSSDELNFILQGISLAAIKYRKRYQQSGTVC